MDAGETQKAAEKLDAYYEEFFTGFSERDRIQITTLALAVRLLRLPAPTARVCRDIAVRMLSKLVFGELR